MQTAHIFNDGNSQAVRLPKVFRFDEDVVIIKKIVDMVILLPMTEEQERDSNESLSARRSQLHVDSGFIPD